MNKFKDGYNPKIDFRFLAFANMNIDQFESTYNLGKVFKGELEATTNNQIDMVKTKKSFELFKEKGINKETIMECIKTFNVVVTNTKLQMLINYINELDKSDYYEYACKLFMFILKKSLFGSINNKMAIKNFLNECNTETKISNITQNDTEILNDFAGSLLKGMKNLDYDISRWVDDNFWDLV